MDTGVSHNLLEYFHAVRNSTEALCAPLITEDYGLQAAAFTSPPKWHLAHTSWFFETFLLQPYLADYRAFNNAYAVLFNSYYQSVGPQFTRAERGLLSRPSVAEIFDYRAQIDSAVVKILSQIDCSQAIKDIVVLGCQHEMQHQELLLTDLKYSFSKNPLYPQYNATAAPKSQPTSAQWLAFPESTYEIGHQGHGFCFDNELPRHKVYQHAFKLSNRLVTNEEYLAFINADGYQNPTFWLSDGYAVAQENQWAAPLYWQQVDGDWWHYTLNGFVPLDPLGPVCHVSYYEADAYARFVNRRLATEIEWEIAATHQSQPSTAAVHLERGYFAPVQAPSHISLFGNVWNWTSSSYNAYPDFQPAAGNVGEYNGKFMANQFVLRGGSCVTPSAQIRASYRNFFYPNDRWQFSGIRLAENTQ